MSANLLQRLKHYDDTRPSFPGEHWLVLGAGIALFTMTRRHPRPLVKILAAVASTALVTRALTGRDVPRPLLRLPYVGR